jgi:hypothetical protein
MWIKWMGHIVLMGEKGNAPNSTVWKSDGNIAFGKPWY